MSTDTSLSELVINKLTKEQYASAEKDANALYMITDEEFVQSINGVSPIDGDLTIKTINGQSILGDGNITIDTGSAIVHEVHGVSDGQTYELPLGMTLISDNQVISVNIGNTLILPTLWTLNASKSSIVLQYPIEDGTMWSVVFTVDCKISGLPTATTDSAGIVKIDNIAKENSNNAITSGAVYALIGNIETLIDEL